MTAIKICGLTREDAARCCADLAVDYTGFICYPPSPRHVNASDFARLARITQTHTKTVLVTVNAENELLEAYIATHRPDFIQCHGEESPERLADIRERFGTGVIKSVPVAHKADLLQTRAYAQKADLLLLDAKPQAGELPGGNARSFDWSVLAGASLPLPWFLSGGLDAENLAQALAASGAAMIDLSSGVESTRGVKDLQKIERLVQHVRELTQHA
jgi:phosphoribosylanthranilate isomerase